MKHLQHPVPSVLDERSDLSPAVGRVISRAMEKRRESRYETVGELVEDFAIAAGMEPAVVVSSGNSSRVAAPTESTAHGLIDEPDEETLVRSRYTRPMAKPRMAVPIPGPGPSFNPWKVLIPSMIGLTVIFAVIYALTRNSQPATQPTPESTLAADPNSQPVEAASPPTGRPEAGIPAGGGGSTQTASPGANENLSSPSPTEDPNSVGNINANDNANENSNTRKNPILPSPSPSASKQVIIDEPPPSPTPTKPAAPKPSLPAQTTSPPGNLP
jgi:hypothetical protein